MYFHSYFILKTIDINDLKEENKNVKNLSAKMKEFGKKIEQITKESIKEKEENEKLRKENECLEQELDVLKYKTSGENSPDTLKKMNKKYLEQISVLESEKGQFEQNISTQNEQFTFIISFINILKGILTNEGNLKITEIEDLLSKAIFDEKLQNALKMLFQEVEKTRNLLNEKIVENSSIKEELKLAIELKDQVAVDLEKLKNGINEQNEGVKNMQNEIEKLTEELQNEKKAKEMQSVDNKKYLQEIINNGIISILKAYENEASIIKNINLAEINKEQNSKDLLDLVGKLIENMNNEIKSLNSIISESKETNKKLDSKNSILSDEILKQRKEIETINQEKESLNQSNIDKIKAKDQELFETEQKYLKIVESFISQQNLSTNRIQLLISQKQFLYREYQNSISKIQNLESKLCEIIGEQQINPDSKKGMNLLKFRKSVLAVIIYNHFIKKKPSTLNKLPDIQQKISQITLSEIRDPQKLSKFISFILQPNPIQKTSQFSIEFTRKLTDKLKNLIIKYGLLTQSQLINQYLSKVVYKYKEFKDLQGELQNAKEREEDLFLQLNKANRDCEEYSENTHKMAKIVDDLHGKLDSMVPIKSYDELKKILDEKNKEIEELNLSNNEVRKELETVKNSITDMENRIKNVDELLSEERKKTMQAECELNMANSKCKALEEALLKKDDENSMLKNTEKRFENEIQDLKNELEISQRQLRDHLLELEKSKDESMQMEMGLKEKEKIVDFYQQKSTKCEEIVKLQELNLQKMEKKCEMLEAAIADLSKENISLKTQPKVIPKSEFKQSSQKQLKEVINNANIGHSDSVLGKPKPIIPGRLAAQSVIVQKPSELQSMESDIKSYQAQPSLKSISKIPGTIMKK